MILYAIEGVSVMNHVVVSGSSQLTLYQILEKDNSSLKADMIEEIRMKSKKL